MLIQIRCLTDGALIEGIRRRAGEQLGLDADDAVVSRLRVAVAAGDIAAELPAPKPVRAARKDSEDK